MMRSGKKHFGPQNENIALFKSKIYLEVTATF